MAGRLYDCRLHLGPLLSISRRHSQRGSCRILCRARDSCRSRRPEGSLRTWDQPVPPLQVMDQQVNTVHCIAGRW